MDHNYLTVQLVLRQVDLSPLKHLSNVRTGLPVACVVIIHSLRNAQSLLPQIISRLTDLQVVEITDDIPIESDKIYVHPPWAKVSLRNGWISKLTELIHS